MHSIARAHAPGFSAHRATLILDYCSWWQEHRGLGTFPLNISRGEDRSVRHQRRHDPIGPLRFQPRTRARLRSALSGLETSTSIDDRETQARRSSLRAAFFRAHPSLSTLTHGRCDDLSCFNRDCCSLQTVVPNELRGSRGREQVS